MELFNNVVPLLLFCLLVLDAASAWSKKAHPDEKTSMETSESKVKLNFSPKKVKQGTTQRPEQVKTPDESKLTPRFSGGNKYILEEEDGEHPVEKEYHESEEHEDEDAREHEQGYHNVGKKVEDSTSKDYHDKGGYSEFKEGGATFDKHKVDNTAENKENEAVRAHDAGEKFGGGALREHQLGKHREKSVGHKKNGFKNVYHKEEYGDHKTFHDEFLDEDRHHEYDDEREERQLQGGRFSKGYRREGENKEFKEGDEAQSWGKEGKDGFREGAYEKGGHVTGHHLGHQKNEGHHEADGQRGRHAVKKYKKGDTYEEKPQYYNSYGGGKGQSYHDKPQYYGGGSGYQHHVPEPVQYHPVEPPYEGRTAEEGQPLSWSKEPEARQPLDDEDEEAPSKHRIQYGAPKPKVHNNIQSQINSDPGDVVRPVKPGQGWSQVRVYNRREPVHSPQQQMEPPVLPMEPVHQPIAQRNPTWNTQFSQHHPLNHVNHGGHSRLGPPQVQHRNLPMSHIRSSSYPWWKQSTQSRFVPSGKRDESQAPSYYYPSQAQVPSNFMPYNRY